MDYAKQAARNLSAAKTRLGFKGKETKPGDLIKAAQAKYPKQPNTGYSKLDNKPEKKPIEKPSAIKIFKSFKAPVKKLPKKPVNSKNPEGYEEDFRAANVGGPRLYKK